MEQEVIFEDRKGTSSYLLKISEEAIRRFELLSPHLRKLEALASDFGLEYGFDFANFTPKIRKPKGMSKKKFESLFYNFAMWVAHDENMSCALEGAFASSENPYYMENLSEEHKEDVENDEGLIKIYTSNGCLVHRNGHPEITKSAEKEFEKDPNLEKILRDLTAERKPSKLRSLLAIFLGALATTLSYKSIKWNNSFETDGEPNTGFLNNFILNNPEFNGANSWENFSGGEIIVGLYDVDCQRGNPNQPGLCESLGLNQYTLFNGSEINGLTMNISEMYLEFSALAGMELPERGIERAGIFENGAYVAEVTVEDGNATGINIYNSSNQPAGKQINEASALSVSSLITLCGAYGLAEYFKGKKESTTSYAE